MNRQIPPIHPYILLRGWRKGLCCWLLCWGMFGLISSQAQSLSRIDSLEVFLDSLCTRIPGLNERTNLSLRDVPISEYIRAVGQEHDVNVFIEDTPDRLLTTNLNQAEVKSIFLFVCKNFDFTIEATGTILEFLPYVAPDPEPELPPKDTLVIQYQAGMLSLDLKDAPIEEVIRRLSELTGRQLLVKLGTVGSITAYLPPTSLDTALLAMFESNGYRLRPSRKGFSLVEGVQAAAAQPADPVSNDYYLETFTNGTHILLSIEATNADLNLLLKEVFIQTDIDYLQYDEVQGQITLKATFASFDELLRHLFRGTEFYFKKDAELYLIGRQDNEWLRSTEIVRLKYRPTFQAVELIPNVELLGGNESHATPTQAAPRQNFSNQPNQNFPHNQGLYNGFQSSFGGGFSGGQAPLSASEPPSIRRARVGEVDIVEYPELNRLILKGPIGEVAELSTFLGEIDRPVPMVKIEMVVVEVNKDRLLSTGIKAGMRSGGGDSTGGKDILPGINYSLDGTDINAILGSVPALSSLGLLKSNFYLQLRAQETRGNLKVRMQPVLSMLNGRQATLTIGQTQYYLLETQTASTGAVNNFQTFTQRFERIEANVTLTLKPYISDDGMVTLDVLPDFTTPVGTFSSEVPPTIATRRFASTIRVRNGETVILGGLTEEALGENTSGLPWLSRVPVLKWIFGNVNKTNQRSSLIIYITPVIYYQ